MATIDAQAKEGQWAEKVGTTTSEHNAAARDTNVAIDNEHKMTLRQSFRFWWKAIVFSFVISLSVIMEGYDTSLMNNFFPFPAFKNKFGDEFDPTDGGKLVSSRWQTIILNGTQVGYIDRSVLYRCDLPILTRPLHRSVASLASSSMDIFPSGLATRRLWSPPCSS